MFPDEQETARESAGSEGEIRAFVDPSLPFSIVSKGMLDQIGEKHTLCKKNPATDAKGVVHTPVGEVDLRWHKKELGKSHSEHFYVVDKPKSIVILGATAFQAHTQSAGGSVQPIGMEQQTAGTSDRS